MLSLHTRWRHSRSMQISTFEELKFTDWITLFVLRIQDFVMHHEYDSLSTQDLQLYWNPNQSCVQTRNWTRVDCVEVQSTNHSVSNTFTHSVSQGITWYHMVSLGTCKLNIIGFDLRSHAIMLIPRKALVRVYRFCAQCNVISYKSSTFTLHNINIESYWCQSSSTII